MGTDVVTQLNGAWLHGNRIDRKHVDFLLCDPTSMRPLVAVELDDRSHQRPRRKERDGFVDQVFEVAGLPLVRVPLRSSYSVSELTVRLGSHLASDEAVVSSATVEVPEIAPTVSVEAASPPNCPTCGVPMVVRRAGRGERKGEPFYGCPNYPKCRETLPNEGTPS